MARENFGCLKTICYYFQGAVLGILPYVTASISINMFNLIDTVLIIWSDLVWLPIVNQILQLFQSQLSGFRLLICIVLKVATLSIYFQGIFIWSRLLILLQHFDCIVYGKSEPFNAEQINEFSVILHLRVG